MSRQNAIGRLVLIVCDRVLAFDSPIKRDKIEDRNLQLGTKNKLGVEDNLQMVIFNITHLIKNTKLEHCCHRVILQAKVEKWKTMNDLCVDLKWFILKVVARQECSHRPDAFCDWPCRSYSTPLVTTSRCHWVNHFMRISIYRIEPLFQSKPHHRSIRCCNFNKVGMDFGGFFIWVAPRFTISKG